jgi:hypothetical protein
MATFTPSRITTLMQGNSDKQSLFLALRPWRRRLIVQRTLHWTIRGSVIGLILANLVLLISRLLPWANARFWAIGIGIACLLFALIVAVWSRPSPGQAARIIDRRLALHDRLGTAWELREERSALAQLQRRDALKQLEEHTPARALSLRQHRALLLLFILAACASVLLVALPNPMDAVLKQQAAFQAHVAVQVQHIEQLRKELAHQAALTPQQKAQADQILRNLEQQLEQAKNETEAQQALAKAQARLDQLRNPLTASKIAAQTAAGNTLQNSTNANLDAVGKALASNDPKSLANALKGLTSQIGKLSPSQRSQLAQQIESAANQASQDPNLSSSLHQLAKAIADGSPSEVTDAANAVQSTADQNAVAEAQDNGISQAEQGVQQAADNLASSTDGTNTQHQGQGQGQNGQNQGQGQNGQNQGQGKEQGGQGQGNTGGENGAGSQQGKNEQVYLPGQIGAGNSTQSDNGNPGQVQPGSPQPYAQVIEQYSKMANDEIDNSNIPPDMKDLIQGYYNALEGQ